MTTPTMEETDRLVRRMQRERLRRYGPTRGVVPLPELDALELRTLLPTSPRPEARPVDSQRSTVDYFYPDGTVIDLPFPENAYVWAEMADQHRQVARSTRYRNGRCLTISTVFLGTDHNYDLIGPPVLWESMVFHGTDRNMGQGIQCWRYASRDAALHGHRLIVHTLDTARRAR